MLAGVAITRYFLRGTPKITSLPAKRTHCEKLCLPYLFCHRNNYTDRSFGQLKSSTWFDPRLRSYLLKVKENHDLGLRNKFQGTQIQFESVQFLAELANQLIQAENELQEVSQLQNGKKQQFPH